jgi:hypothetical protein
MRYGNRTRLGTQVQNWLPEPAFSPSSLPNLVVWWDAADETSFTYSSGTDVSQWDDKSGNGYHLTQGTAAKQPSRSGSVNGRATVVFDGSNDSMSGSSVAMGPGQKFSIATVFSSVSGGDRIIVEQTSNFNNTPGAFILFRTTNDTVEMGKRGSNLYSQIRTSNTITTTPSLLVGTHDGALASFETWGGINDTLTFSYVLNNNTNSDNVTADLFVGARNNASVFLNGQIAEIIITRAVFTRTERLAVQNYLANKWGVTL